MTTVLTRRYIAKSWIDPRIEVRTSSIQGKGMFACKSIRQGEIVVIWGGEVFSEAEIQAGLARDRSTVTIGDGLYLGGRYDSLENLDEFMNHHCDPNVWLQDEVTLITRRDVAKGEELTIDYALWETNSSWRMACYCNSPLCRKEFTGDDWKLPELQKRYQGHFSPYLATRIKNSKLL